MKFQPWMILLIMPLLGVVAMIAVIVSDNNADESPQDDNRIVTNGTPPAQTLPPRTPQPTPTSVIDQPIPDVVLTDLNGDTFTLRDYVGKIVVMNYWATWCVPCEEEMPQLQAFSEAYADQNIVVVAITTPDELQDVDTIRLFMDERNLTLRVGLETVRSELYYGLGIHNLGIPTTFFIDQSGVIRSRFWGQITYDELVAEVNLLIESDS